MFASKTAQTDGDGTQAPRTTSEIAEGLSVAGDMDGDGDVRLDGRLEGNVRCRALTIGTGGELVGRVTAQEVTVQGTVNGDIKATQVKLESSARVSGDVVHEVLEIAAGARVEGRYSRGEDKLRKEPAVATPKEPPPRVPPKPLSKPGNGQGQQRPHVAAGTARPAAAAKTPDA